MGGESFPIRRGAIGRGNPEQFNYHQIIQKIKAADSSELHRLAGTYDALLGLFQKATSDLAFHRGRLKGAWPAGSSSDAALAQIQRMEQAASELAEVSHAIGFVLKEAGIQIDTFKSNVPSVPTDLLGTPIDPKTETLMGRYAKDREAQQYMARMNQTLAELHSLIPESVTLDLPGPDRGEFSGQPPARSATPEAGAGNAGSSAGRAAPLPDTSPLPQSQAPENPSLPPPGNPGGGIPGSDGSGEGGGSDLEGVTPGGSGGIPSGGPGPGGPGAVNPGPNHGGAIPGGLGPSGIGPIAIAPGSGSIKPVPAPPRAGGLGPHALAPNAGGLRPGAIGSGGTLPTPGPSSRTSPLNPSSAGLKPGPLVSGAIGGRAPGGGLTSPRGGVSSAQPGGVLGVGRTTGDATPRGAVGGQASGGSGAAARPTGTAASGRRAVGTAGRSRERDGAAERHSWLTEEDDVWTDDEGTTPPVIR